MLDILQTKPAVVTLTRRLLYLEESVTHIAAMCPAPCSAAQIPRPQDKLSQLLAAEPAGSSHSASVTGPPACPCL